MKEVNTKALQKLETEYRQRLPDHCSDAKVEHAIYASTPMGGSALKNLPAMATTMGTGQAFKVILPGMMDSTTATPEMQAYFAAFLARFLNNQAVCATVEGLANAQVMNSAHNQQPSVRPDASVQSVSCGSSMGEQLGWRRQTSQTTTISRICQSRKTRTG